jgi:hypothetical protein
MSLKLLPTPHHASVALSSSPTLVLASLVIVVTDGTTAVMSAGMGTVMSVLVIKAVEVAVALREGVEDVAVVAAGLHHGSMSLAKSAIRKDIMQKTAGPVMRRMMDMVRKRSTPPMGWTLIGTRTLVQLITSLESSITCL